MATVKKSAEMFKLEDRVLFDAAAVAEIEEAAQAAENPDPNANMSETDRQAQEDRNALKNAGPTLEGTSDAEAGKVVDTAIADIDAQDRALIEGEAAQNGVPTNLTDFADYFSGKRYEEVTIDPESQVTLTSLADDSLVIVDSSLPGGDSLLASAEAEGRDVLVLDESEGLEDILSYLQDSGKEYGSIHFFTHANRHGIIKIGTDIVSDDNVMADAWRQVGDYLTTDGDIMFYGCELAKDGEGRSICRQISELTDADVAASDDVTGISGDWELEYKIGDVDHDVFQPSNYEYDLAATKTLTVNVAEDPTGDIVYTDDDISLREAVSIVNDDYYGTEMRFIATDKDGEKTYCYAKLSEDGKDLQLYRQSGAWIHFVLNEDGDTFVGKELYQDWTIAADTIKANESGEVTAAFVINHPEALTEAGDIRLSANADFGSDYKIVFNLPKETTEVMFETAFTVVDTHKGLTIEGKDDITINGSWIFGAETSVAFSKGIYTTKDEAYTFTVMSGAELSLNGVTLEGGKIQLLNAGHVIVGDDVAFLGKAGTTAIENVEGDDLIDAGKVTFDGKGISISDFADGAIENKGELEFNGEVDFYGNGIAINNVATGSATFNGATTFENNLLAIANAGSIGFSDGNHTYFVNNGGKSGNGGAITTTTDFETKGDVRFIANHAALTGGAIFIDGAKVTINEGTIFSENYATKGGAIYLKSGELAVQGGEFNDNWATDGENATKGGAIYAEDGTLLSISGGTFKGNTTGRVLVASDDTIPEVVWVKDHYNYKLGDFSYDPDAEGLGKLVQFHDAATGYDFTVGGTAEKPTFETSYVKDDKLQTVKATVTEVKDDNDVVTGFKVGYKDANDTECEFTIETTKLTETFKIEVREGSKGGAIYVGAGDKLTVNGAKFDGNRSEDGGAIYSERNKVVIQSAAFENNSATGKGGALVSTVQSGYAQSLTIDDSTFVGNKAGTDASAVWANDYEVSTSASKFIANEAGKNAGAILTTENNFGFHTLNDEYRLNVAGEDAGAVLILPGNKQFTSTGTLFEGNEAGEDGGAIKITDSPRAEMSLTKFVDNKAGGKGGAIYAEGTSLTAMGLGNAFTGNEAEGEGGAIFADRGVLTLKDTVFTGNKSLAGEGGAVKMYDTTFLSESSTYEGNSAVRGGAIAYTYNGKVEAAMASVEDSTFKGNTAEVGGAIALTYDAVDTTLPGNESYHPAETIIVRVNDTTFEGNEAVYFGGAIDAGKGVSAVIKGDQFTGNRVTGAMSLEDLARQIIDDPTLRPWIAVGLLNSIDYTVAGGAISNHGRLTVENTSFTSNEVVEHDPYRFTDDKFDFGAWVKDEKSGALKLEETLMKDVFGRIDYNEDGEVVDSSSVAEIKAVRLGDYEIAYKLGEETLFMLKLGADGKWVGTAGKLASVTDDQGVKHDYKVELKKVDPEDKDSAVLGVKVTDKTKDGESSYEIFYNREGANDSERAEALAERTAHQMALRTVTGEAAVAVTDAAKDAPQYARIDWDEGTDSYTVIYDGTVYGTLKFDIPEGKEDKAWIFTLDAAFKNAANKEFVDAASVSKVHDSRLGKDIDDYTNADTKEITSSVSIKYTDENGTAQKLFTLDLTKLPKNEVLAEELKTDTTIITLNIKGAGGALFTNSEKDEFTSTTVATSTFFNNSADIGGAMYTGAVEWGAAQFDRDGNIVSQAGRDDRYFEETGAVRTTVVDSTIVGNTSRDVEGYAIQLNADADGTETYLVDDVIVANQRGDATGIYDLHVRTRFVDDAKDGINDNRFFEFFTVDKNGNEQILWTVDDANFAALSADAQGKVLTDWFTSFEKFWTGTQFDQADTGLGDIYTADYQNLKMLYTIYGELKSGTTIPADYYYSVGNGTNAYLDELAKGPVGEGAWLNDKANVRVTTEDVALAMWKANFGNYTVDKDYLTVKDGEKSAQGKSIWADKDGTWFRGVLAKANYDANKANYEDWAAALKSSITANEVIAVVGTDNISIPAAGATSEAIAAAVTTVLANGTFEWNDDLTEALTQLRDGLADLSVDAEKVADYKAAINDFLGKTKDDGTTVSVKNAELLKELKDAGIDQNGILTKALAVVRAETMRSIIAKTPLTNTDVTITVDLSVDASVDAMLGYVFGQTKEEILNNEFGGKYIDVFTVDPAKWTADRVMNWIGVGNRTVETEATTHADTYAKLDALNKFELLWSSMKEDEQQDFLTNAWQIRKDGKIAGVDVDEGGKTLEGNLLIVNTKGEPLFNEAITLTEWLTNGDMATKAKALELWLDAKKGDENTQVAKKDDGSESALKTIQRVYGETHAKSVKDERGFETKNTSAAADVNPEVIAISPIQYYTNAYIKLGHDNEGVITGISWARPVTNDADTNIAVGSGPKAIRLQVPSEAKFETLWNDVATLPADIIGADQMGVTFNYQFVSNRGATWLQGDETLSTSLVVTQIEDRPINAEWDGTEETKKNVQINSFDDIDLTDGTSLRELLWLIDNSYAQANADLDGDGILEGYRVTFDDSLFYDSEGKRTKSIEITMNDSMLWGNDKEYVMTRYSGMYNLVIDGGSGRNVTIKAAEAKNGEDNYSFMETILPEDREKAIIFNLTLSHLTIANFRDSAVKMQTDENFDNGGKITYRTDTTQQICYSTVTVDNTVFEGNVAANGAAISMNKGSVYLTSDSTSYYNLRKDGQAGTQFVDNEATKDGGAIYVASGKVVIGQKDGVGEAHETTVSTGDVLFSGNKAADKGGAIYVKQADDTEAKPTVNSYVLDQYSAAVSLSGYGTVTFEGNEATFGGALYADGAVTAAGNNSKTIGAGNVNTLMPGYTSLVLKDNKVGSDDAAKAQGGAIWAANSIDLKLNNLSITGNSATGNTAQGGAIYAQNDATLTLAGNAKTAAITGNSVTAKTLAQGGAIWTGDDATVETAVGGEMFIITKNSAKTTDAEVATQTAQGGVIAAKGKATIRNAATVTGNTVSAVSKGQSGTLTAEGGVIWAKDADVAMFDTTTRAYWTGNTATVAITKPEAEAAPDGVNVTAQGGAVRVTDSLKMTDVYATQNGISFTNTYGGKLGNIDLGGGFASAKNTASIFASEFGYNTIVATLAGDALKINSLSAQGGAIDVENGALTLRHTINVGSNNSPGNGVLRNSITVKATATDKKVEIGNYLVKGGAIHAASIGGSAADYQLWDVKFTENSISSTLSGYEGVDINSGMKIAGGALAVDKNSLYVIDTFFNGNSIKSSIVTQQNGTKEGAINIKGASGIEGGAFWYGGDKAIVFDGGSLQNSTITSDVKAPGDITLEDFDVDGAVVWAGKADSITLGKALNGAEKAIGIEVTGNRTISNITGNSDGDEAGNVKIGALTVGGAIDTGNLAFNDFLGLTNNSVVSTITAASLNLANLNIGGAAVNAFMGKPPATPLDATGDSRITGNKVSSTIKATGTVTFTGDSYVYGAARVGSITLSNLTATGNSVTNDISAKEVKVDGNVTTGAGVIMAQSGITLNGDMIDETKFAPQTQGQQLMLASSPMLLGENIRSRVTGNAVSSSLTADKITIVANKLFDTAGGAFYGQEGSTIKVGNADITDNSLTSKVVARKSIHGPGAIGIHGGQVRAGSFTGDDANVNAGNAAVSFSLSTPVLKDGIGFQDDGSALYVDGTAKLAGVNIAGGKINVKIRVERGDDDGHNVGDISLRGAGLYIAGDLVMRGTNTITNCSITYDLQSKHSNAIEDGIHMAAAMDLVTHEGVDYDKNGIDGYKFDLTVGNVSAGGGAIWVERNADIQGLTVNNNEISLKILNKAPERTSAVRVGNVDAFGGGLAVGGDAILENVTANGNKLNVDIQSVTSLGAPKAHTTAGLYVDSVALRGGGICVEGQLTAKNITTNNNKLMSLVRADSSGTIALDIGFAKAYADSDAVLTVAGAYHAQGGGVWSGTDSTITGITAKDNNIFAEADATSMLSTANAAAVTVFLNEFLPVIRAEALATGDAIANVIDFSVEGGALFCVGDGTIDAKNGDYEIKENFMEAVLLANSTLGLTTAVAVHTSIPIGIVIIPVWITNTGAEATSHRDSYVNYTRKADGDYGSFLEEMKDTILSGGDDDDDEEEEDEPEQKEETEKKDDDKKEEGKEEGDKKDDDKKEESDKKDDDKKDDDKKEDGGSKGLGLPWPFSWGWDVAKIDDGEALVKTLLNADKGFFYSPGEKNDDSAANNLNDIIDKSFGGKYKSADGHTYRESNFTVRGADYNDGFSVTFSNPLDIFTNSAIANGNISFATQLALHGSAPISVTETFSILTLIAFPQCFPVPTMVLNMPLFDIEINDSHTRGFNNNALGNTYLDVKNDAGAAKDEALDIIDSFFSPSTIFDIIQNPMGTLKEVISTAAQDMQEAGKVILRDLSVLKFSATFYSDKIAEMFLSEKPSGPHMLTIPKTEITGIDLHKAKTGGFELTILPVWPFIVPPGVPLINTNVTTPMNTNFWVMYIDDNLGNLKSYFFNIPDLSEITDGINSTISKTKEAIGAVEEGLDIINGVFDSITEGIDNISNAIDKVVGFFEETPAADKPVTRGQNMTFGVAATEGAAAVTVTIDSTGVHTAGGDITFTDGKAEQDGVRYTMSTEDGVTTITSEYAIDKKGHILNGDPIEGTNYDYIKVVNTFETIDDVSHEVTRTYVYDNVDAGGEYTDALRDTCHIVDKQNVNGTLHIVHDYTYSDMAGEKMPVGEGIAMVLKDLDADPNKTYHQTVYARHDAETDAWYLWNPSERDYVRDPGGERYVVEIHDNGASGITTDISTRTGYSKNVLCTFDYVYVTKTDSNGSTVLVPNVYTDWEGNVHDGYDPATQKVVYVGSDFDHTMPVVSGKGEVEGKISSYMATPVTDLEGHHVLVKDAEGGDLRVVDSNGNLVTINGDYGDYKDVYLEVVGEYESATKLEHSAEIVILAGNKEAKTPEITEAAKSVANYTDINAADIPCKFSGEAAKEVTLTNEATGTETTFVIYRYEQIRDDGATGTSFYKIAGSNGKFLSGAELKDAVKSALSYTSEQAQAAKNAGNDTIEVKAFEWESKDGGWSVMELGGDFSEKSVFNDSNIVFKRLAGEYPEFTVQTDKTTGKITGYTYTVGAEFKNTPVDGNGHAAFRVIGTDKKTGEKVTLVDYVHEGDAKSEEITISAPSVDKDDPSGYTKFLIGQGSKIKNGTFQMGLELGKFAWKSDGQGTAHTDGQAFTTTYTSEGNFVMVAKDDTGFADGGKVVTFERTVDKDTGAITYAINPLTITVGAEGNSYEVSCTVETRTIDIEMVEYKEAEGDDDTAKPYAQKWDSKKNAWVDYDKDPLDPENMNKDWVWKTRKESVELKEIVFNSDAFTGDAKLDQDTGAFTVNYTLTADAAAAIGLAGKTIGINVMEGVMKAKVALDADGNKIEVPANLVLNSDGTLAKDLEGSPIYSNYMDMDFEVQRYEDGTVVYDANGHVRYTGTKDGVTFTYITDGSGRPLLSKDGYPLNAVVRVSEFDCYEFEWHNDDVDDKDKVVKKDRAGNIVYEMDEEGKPKLDDDGNKIPVKVGPDLTAEVDPAKSRPVYKTSETYLTDKNGNVVYFDIDDHDNITWNNHLGDQLPPNGSGKYACSMPSTSIVVALNATTGEPMVICDQYGNPVRSNCVTTDGQALKWTDDGSATNLAYDLAGNPRYTLTTPNGAAVSYDSDTGIYTTTWDGVSVEVIVGKDGNIVTRSFTAYDGDGNPTGTKEVPVNVMTAADGTFAKDANGKPLYLLMDAEGNAITNEVNVVETEPETTTVEPGETFAGLGYEVSQENGVAKVSVSEGSKTPDGMKVGVSVEFSNETIEPEITRDHGKITEIKIGETIVTKDTLASDLATGSEVTIHQEGVIHDDAGITAVWAAKTADGSEKAALDTTGRPIYGWSVEGLKSMTATTADEGFPISGSAEYGTGGNTLKVTISSDGSTIRQAEFVQTVITRETSEWTKNEETGIWTRDEAIVKRVTTTVMGSDGQITTSVTVSKDITRSEGSAKGQVNFTHARSESSTATIKATEKVETENTETEETEQQQLLFAVAPLQMEPLVEDSTLDLSVTVTTASADQLPANIMMEEGEDGQMHAVVYDETTCGGDTNLVGQYIYIATDKEGQPITDQAGNTLCLTVDSDGVPERTEEGFPTNVLVKDGKLVVDDTGAAIRSDRPIFFVNEEGDKIVANDAEGEEVASFTIERKPNGSVWVDFNGDGSSDMQIQIIRDANNLACTLSGRAFAADMDAKDGNLTLGSIDQWGNISTIGKPVMATTGILHEKSGSATIDPSSNGSGMSLMTVTCKSTDESFANKEFKTTTEIEGTDGKFRLVKLVDGWYLDVVEKDAEGNPMPSVKGERAVTLVQLKTGDDSIQYAVTDRSTGAVIVFEPAIEAEEGEEATPARAYLRDADGEETVAAALTYDTAASARSVALTEAEKAEQADEEAKVIYVTNANGGNAEGSLAWAITEATKAGGKTVKFAENLFVNDQLVIEVGSSIDLNGNVSIDGGEGRTVTIKVQEAGMYFATGYQDDRADWVKAGESGVDASDYSVFTSTGGEKLTLKHVNLIGGGVEEGGAIQSNGALTIEAEDVYISRGSAELGGGAISAATTLKITGDGLQIAANNADFGGAISADNVTIIAEGEGIRIAHNETEGDGNSSETEWIQEATGNGGAIYAKSIVDLKADGDAKLVIAANEAGTGTTASKDSVGKGGAIYVANGNVRFGSDTGITFYGNEAKGDGGAIWTKQTELEPEMNEFIGNIAGGNGGAIYDGQDKSTMIFNGTKFIGNEAKESGGAVYSNGTWMTIDKALFEDNTAGKSGGAVRFVTPEKLDPATDPSEWVETILTIQNASFIGNKAGTDGGAIMNDYGRVTVKGKSSLFDGNIAVEGNGGALFNNASTTIGEGATFDGNIAGENGGALNLTGGYASINKVTFVDNQAEKDGGAVSASDDMSSLLLYRSTFSGNVAGENGGAISLADGLTTFLRGNTYDYNSAGNAGGAIYVKSGANVESKDDNFYANTAKKSGGAIANGGATLTVEDATLVANRAQMGGAVAAIDAKGTTNISNSMFSANFAAQNGGAAYAKAGTLTMTDSAFDSNAAGQKGGAIFAEGVGNINVVQETAGAVTFDHNTAVKAGGAIAAEGATSSITVESKDGGIDFTNNATGIVASTYAWIVSTAKVEHETAEQLRGNYGKMRRNDGRRDVGGPVLSDEQDNLVKTFAGFNSSVNTRTRDEFNKNDTTYSTMGGGAISAANNGSITISGVGAIQSNTAYNGNGGAISVMNGGQVEIKDAAEGSTINGNRADEHGGALFVSGTGSNIKMDGTLSSVGTNAAGYGGYVAVMDGAKYLIANGDLGTGKAAQAGGLVYVKDAQADIVGVSMTNGFAPSGNGALVAVEGNGAATIVSSTLHGVLGTNSVAVSANGSGAKLALVNTSVVANEGTGIAVTNGAQAALVNVLALGNGRHEETVMVDEKPTTEWVDGKNIVVGSGSKIKINHSITDQATLDRLSALDANDKPIYLNGATVEYIVETVKEGETETEVITKVVVPGEDVIAAETKDIFVKVDEKGLPVGVETKNSMTSPTNGGAQALEKVSFTIKGNTPADEMGTMNPLGFLTGFSFATDTVSRYAGFDATGNAYDRDIGSVAKGVPENPILINDWQQPYRTNKNFMSQGAWDHEIASEMEMPLEEELSFIGKDWSAFNSQIGGSGYAHLGLTIAPTRGMLPIDNASAIMEEFDAIKLDGIGADFLDRNAAFGSDFDRVLEHMMH